MNENMELFNSLWACSIHNIDFDIFHNRIVLDLVEQEDNLHHKFELIDVHSYLWISRSGDPKKNCFEPIYNEFTSIVFKNIFIDTKNDKWLKQYFLDYNLSIEIMDGALLVNAKSLILDEKKLILFNVV